MEVTEGGRLFEVPDGDEVFYNPAMELNRDVTVAVERAARDGWLDADGPSYLDAMTATGVRGVRAGLEGFDVTVCDVDGDAVALARRNADRHDVDIASVVGDVRPHCYGHRYDMVDLDPFGSPMPYVEPAVHATQGLLCVTATDTAPLCGAHFEAGVRRYGAVPANTTDHAEVGLRVLVSAVVRAAARHDVALAPVLGHATRHYVRTYLAVERGARAADRALEGLGFRVDCRRCLERETVEGLAPPLPAACDSCGGPVDRIGPIWLDRYADPEATEAVADAIDDDMGEAVAARRLLDRLGAELDVAGHHDHHELCDRWTVPAGPIEDVLAGLRSAGYAASRTHFGGTTFKTDAPVEAIRPVVEEHAPSP